MRLKVAGTLFSDKPSYAPAWAHRLARSKRAKENALLVLFSVLGALAVIAFFYILPCLAPLP